MNDYTFDPDSWPPVLAGVAAGAIGAIVAAIVGELLTPNVIERPHSYANSLTVVLTAIALGAVSGWLWRRVRASVNATTVFSWSMVGGFFAALAAIVIANQTVLKSLAPYAMPLTAIVFITLGFFVPLLSRVTGPRWIAAIPAVVALGIGIGLFI